MFIRDSLKTLPTNADRDSEADKLSLSGTTVVSIPYTSAQTHPQPTHNSSSLKRAGTLSRLARFLSSSSSGAGTGSNPLSRRRATVAGEGQQQGRRAKVGRSATVAAGGNGQQWPGSGPGHSGVRRKRATTFDEILGTQ